MPMRPTRVLLVSLLVGLLPIVVGCGRKSYRVPGEAEPTNQQVRIFPDYRDVTIPPNIAPLNFLIYNADRRSVVSIRGEASEIVGGAGKDGVVQFDADEWSALLSSNAGKQLSVTVYSQSETKQWFKHPGWTLTVAPDTIDSYLSYRLIEPGYELYRQLGLYQRNITNFDVTTIYQNNSKYEDQGNHCANCHNYQNYTAASGMLFHVRAAYGGTVVARGDQIKKFNIKHDSLSATPTYPAWHPTMPLVAFSCNLVGQTFHTVDLEKIEVLDHGSDLALYDVENNQLSHIRSTRSEMETFPTWAPSGDRLYYCSTYLEYPEGMSDSIYIAEITRRYKWLYYDIYSMPFDTLTKEFGEPRLEVNCAAMHKSASVPRISSDGRYLLFTLGDYGQFHIWHHSADLYVKDLETDSIYPLSAANSKAAESFHSWSSTGRWIAFSSRRDDGNFTRVYIAYFDRDGKAHKAFMLPQEDPRHNLRLFKSYNVPELTRDAVAFSTSEIRRVVRQTEAEPVSFKK